MQIGVLYLIYSLRVYHRVKPRLH